MAVVEAWRFFTQETGAARAAAHAAEIQSIRTKSALEAEQVASDALATAKGKERAAQLDALQASRARAAQALQTAKALQAEARASIAAARAEARKRYETSSGDTGFLATFGRALGGAGGAAPTITPGTASAIRIDRQADFAQRKLEESEKSFAAAEGAIDGLDKAIAAATASTGLPKLATGLVNAGDAAKRSAASTKSASDELQDLIDRLFPAEAGMREAQESLALLKKAFDSGKISADRYSEAVAQLWRNFLGGHSDGWKSDGLSSMTESVEKISDQISGRFVDAMEKLAEKSGLTKTMVVKSFKDMADETMSALSRLSDAIRGGGFLDILQGIVGLGLQLGSIGAFGRKIAANINRPVGQNANGTSYWSGGLSWVGERGPELVDLPRGARVTPNNDLRGMMGGGIAQIVPSPYFDVVVDRRVYRAAPGIASAGASGGVAQIQRRGSRRLA